MPMESFRERYAARQRNEKSASSNPAKPNVVEYTNIESGQNKIRLEDTLLSHEESTKNEDENTWPRENKTCTSKIPSTLPDILANTSTVKDTKVKSEPDAVPSKYYNPDVEEDTEKGTTIRIIANSDISKVTMQIPSYEDLCTGSLNNPQTTTPSMSEISQDWIEMVSQKLNDLRISQIAKGSPDEIFSVEDMKGIPDLMVSYITSGLETISQQVRPLESILKDAIDLPNQLRERLTLVQEAKHNISDHLPHEIYKSFMGVFDRFILKYKTRREEILRKQDKFMSDRLDDAVVYYSGEMRYVLGNTFIDSDSFNASCQEISKKTERAFPELAGKTELSNRLRTETEELEKQNEAKKKQEEKILGKIEKDCMQKYEGFIRYGENIREFSHEQSAALEIYGNIALESKKKTSKHFQDEIAKHPLNKQLIFKYSNDLNCKLGQHLSSALNDIQAKIQEAKIRNQQTRQSTNSTVPVRDLRKRNGNSELVSSNSVADVTVRVAEQKFSSRWLMTLFIPLCCAIIVSVLFK